MTLRDFAYIGDFEEQTQKQLPMWTWGTARLERDDDGAINWILEGHQQTDRATARLTLVHNVRQGLGARPDLALAILTIDAVSGASMVEFSGSGASVVAALDGARRAIATHNAVLDGLLGSTQIDGLVSR